MCLPSNVQQRQKMAISGTKTEFREIVNHLKEKYEPFHEGHSTWDGEPDVNNTPDYNLKIPPWICQPYYRMPPEEHLQKLEDIQKSIDKCGKRKYFDDDGNAISRKHMKKLRKMSKRMRNKEHHNRHGEICIFYRCKNTKGLKCLFQYCKTCCRDKCFNENLDCTGHKLFVKEKQEKKEHYEQMKMDGLEAQEAQEQSEVAQ